MKIIFLDFDGPLSNSLVTLGYGDHHIMDPVACRALNNICEVSGVKIVCTSSRAVVGHESYKENMHWFKEAGLDINHIHPDWSCNTGNGQRRYDQIQKWLKDHAEVTHYAVVDDEGIFNSKGEMHPNFVRTGMYDGMGYRQFRKLATLLDFNLAEAFALAHYKKDPPGQLMLPLEHYKARSNADILIQKITDTEKESGLWHAFSGVVQDRILEDGNINVTFVLKDHESLGGNLYVAPQNVREEGRHTLFLRNGAHSLLVAKVT